MVITKLMGGNGNQMFQYAAGFSIANRLNLKLLVDVNYLQDKNKRYFKFEDRDYTLYMYNISGEIASDNKISQFIVPRKGNKYFYHLERRVLSEKNVIREESLSTLASFGEIVSDCYLEGYWQNPFYFKDCETEIRREFSFKNKLPEICMPILQRIGNSNSVCVHIRRGDFVNHPILEVVNTEFYYKALTILSEIVSSPRLFVFSDDIPWCRENFKPYNFDYEFVDPSLSGPHAECHLHLITLCKHFIIPNSTFSWWGAWLSTSPGKIVIAPKKWFKGQAAPVNAIVPKEWIAI